MENVKLKTLSFFVTKSSEHPLFFNFSSYQSKL